MEIPEITLSFHSLGRIETERRKKREPGRMAFPPQALITLSTLYTFGTFYMKFPLRHGQKAMTEFLVAYVV